MTLDDIQTAITELSTEDLEDLLKAIRNNRTKETILVTKVKENKTALDKMISNMSQDDLAKLMASLLK